MTVNFSSETVEPEESDTAFFKMLKERGEDSRWRCENNPGLELALNPQTVSQSCISRLIFVAHGTGKFPSEEETRDTRQNLRMAKLAARVVGAGPSQ